MTFRSPEDRLGTGLGEGDRVLKGVEAGLEPMRHSTFRLPLSTGNFRPGSPELWRIGELFLSHDVFHYHQLLFILFDRMSEMCI